MNLVAGKLNGVCDRHSSGVQRSQSHARRPGRGRAGALTRPTRLVAAASALLLPMVMALHIVAASAAVAPVGQGFTVTPSDLAFILKQIKIAERHSAAVQGSDPSIPANPLRMAMGKRLAALVGALVGVFMR